jgi:choline dehydrogenase
LQQIFWPRGKLLGGSDAFSNMIYARGNPQDYDEWALGGATGWSYEDVLPYFIKSENIKNALLRKSSKLVKTFLAFGVT